ncbi:MAG TPA: PD-(D/E)XK nuclease family protein [Candidatus Nanoarchaeia archaeon]|nr:PD-(D/E)XK nuclease family protein [Candidatus Nanoarchaeia archaeon]
MTTYSHSKLGTFQQCKQKYKFQYIDKIKLESKDTIETFLGSLVHKTLEKLYKDLKFQKLNTKEELINFFKECWNKEWYDKILIVKDYTKENYFNMGIKFISDYYEHYKPFNNLTTLGIETEYRLDLDDGNQYHVRMDRLSCDKEGNYYVCDYKTNNQLKAQGELDEDRQLAMYSLWVKNNFKDCKNIKLVWYFLAFDKEMISERNEEQLLQLRNDVQNIIKEIENCKNFPTTISALCDWCNYKPTCPAWKHEIELEAKTEEEFKDDDGVKLVDALDSLESSRKNFENEIEKIQDKLIKFAKQKAVSVVWGSNKKASIKEYTKVGYPEDKTELTELLKQMKLYDKYSMICYQRLSPSILKNQIDSAIISLVKKEKDYRINLSKRKDE